MIVVVKPGFLTCVQDRGRYGVAALGIGHAGAMDDVAARLPNALVGNARDDALLEITLVGPTLRCETDTVVARVADERVREPRGDVVHRAGMTDAESGDAVAAAVLHAGQKSGFDDEDHAEFFVDNASNSSWPIARNRTRSPGATRFGGVRERSNSASGVRPIRFQPPGSVCG